MDKNINLEIMNERIKDFCSKYQKCSYCPLNSLEDLTYCYDGGEIDPAVNDDIRRNYEFLDKNGYLKSEAVSETILKKALNLITDNENGNIENSLYIIADFLSTYLDTELSPLDVAAMLILLKISKIKNGEGKLEDWIDIVKYAAYGGEVQGTSAGGRENEKRKKA